ncbi:MAG: LLM class F420-dependent oxidoreductase [Dehalococcoidia bacterium]|nr:LLM class F420-dependent oxidoreductase [Dehalococcoidia bacterium]MSQ16155.1 LLM class F420-dependent oxidoreductase [Dehalococcoidia bacterium]
MDIGVIFPQTEIGPDPGAVREFAQAAEDLGYTHLFIADHVLGGDPQHHPHLANSYYTHHSVMHEPFTLMGYLAGVTKRVGLGTGILILPQRQTALVAKQAAEVDVLSGGRMRLGVGVGWNPLEYQALNQDFHNRGRRSEEQVAVLRALWTQEVVNFQGRWHHITHAGLNPLPVQRPIPIWFGAGSSASPTPPEPVLRRIAQIADGWFPSFPPNQAGREAIGQLRAYVAEAGREQSAVGVEARLRLAGKQPEDWANEVREWQDIGATSLVVEARRGGIGGVEGHIDAIQRFRDVVPRA